MSGISRLLRVSVLAICAVWLIRTPAVHAQFGGTCINQFETGNGTPCFLCCPSQPQDNNIIQGIIDASQGTQSADYRRAYCGGGTCNGGDCGNVDYSVAVEDGTCCFPSGRSCTSQGQCCSGLVCLYNDTCGVCTPLGGACSDPRACCSQECETGTCVTCLSNGQYCAFDSDCCSGFCGDNLQCCLGYGQFCTEDSDCCSGNFCYYNPDTGQSRCYPVA